MSVTVAAALKKVAAAVLTDKKAGKTVGSVVLAVILIAIFPIVGVTGALGSLGKADAAQLQAILAENLSGNEIEKLQTFEDTMRAIESAMAEAEKTDPPSTFSAFFPSAKKMSFTMVYPAATYFISLFPFFCAPHLRCRRAFYSFLKAVFEK